MTELNALTEPSEFDDYLHSDPDTLKTAARRQENALHRAADAHRSKVEVALRYAFAVGRKKLHEGVASVADAQPAIQAVESALQDVLPSALEATIIDGLRASGTILGPKLKVAEEAGHEFHGNQWTDQHGEVSGYIVEPKPGYKLDESQLNTEDSAEREFYRAIREQYPQGVTVFHETPLENVASIKREGLLEDQFASIGRPSDYVTTADKGILEARLTPRQSANISPDMEYDPDNRWADLLRRHQGVYGAYVSLNQSIPRSQITLRIKQGGKLRTAAPSLLVGPLGPILGVLGPLGPLVMRLDASNPKVKEAAQQQAGDLIKGISQTTRDRIATAIGDSATRERDRQSTPEVSDRALFDEILAAIGDEHRAQTIARTETMRAVNEGQSLLWDEAIEDGLLSPDDKQVWIATDDELTCPICGELDGQEVGLQEGFDSEDGEIDGPPAHPNCRCTVGLASD